jgi:hypothetical protein
VPCIPLGLAFPIIGIATFFTCCSNPNTEQSLSPKAVVRSEAGGPGPVPPSKTAVVPDTRSSEPVASLKAVIGLATQELESESGYIDSYDRYGKIYWYRAFYKLVDVEYDVTKTDSLVSPLVGVIKIGETVTQAVESYPSKDEAVKAPRPNKSHVEINPTPTRVQARLALQDGKWVLRSVEFVDGVVDTPSFQELVKKRYTRVFRKATQ